MHPQVVSAGAAVASFMLSPKSSDFCYIVQKQRERTNVTVAAGVTIAKLTCKRLVVCR